MRRGVLIIALLVALLLGLVTTYSLFDSITGRQVFEDDEFTKPVSSFKSGRAAPNILLSPEECSIRNISFERNNYEEGEIANILIEGENCNDETVDLEIFEKDLIFDDEFGTISGNFVNDVAVINLLISEETTDDLFKELFEGNKLEIYAQLTSNDSLRSDVIQITKAEDDPIHNVIGVPTARKSAGALEIDNGGKIDCPEDLDCTSVNDNNELGVNSLIDYNTTFGEDEPDNITETEEVLSIRIIFLTTIVLFAVGIIVVSFLIIRFVRKNKFSEGLTYIPNY